MYALIVAQQQDWGNWIQRAIGHDLIALVAVGGGLLMCIIAVVAKNWRHVRIAEIEGALKQQMLDKGMSAADIEQVLRTSRSRTPTECATAQLFAKTVVDIPALVNVLAEHGYAGEDIERILRTLPSEPSADPRFHEKVATIQNMVEHEMPAEDIERVLLACPRPGTPGAATPTV